MPIRHDALLAAAKEGTEALKDIINAAGNSEPYTTIELEDVFGPVVEQMICAIEESEDGLSQGNWHHGKLLSNAENDAWIVAFAAVMTCREIIEVLRDCDCNATLHKGILWLEDGTSFDLAGAISREEDTDGQA